MERSKNFRRGGGGTFPYSAPLCAIFDLAETKTHQPFFRLATKHRCRRNHQQTANRRGTPQANTALMTYRQGASASASVTVPAPQQVSRCQCLSKCHGASASATVTVPAPQQVSRCQRLSKCHGASASASSTTDAKG